MPETSSGREHTAVGAAGRPLALGPGTNSTRHVMRTPTPINTAAAKPSRYEFQVNGACRVRDMGIGGTTNGIGRPPTAAAPKTPGPLGAVSDAANTPNPADMVVAVLGAHAAFLYYTRRVTQFLERARPCSARIRASCATRNASCACTHEFHVTPSMWTPPPTDIRNVPNGATAHSRGTPSWRARAQSKLQQHLLPVGDLRAALDAGFARFGAAGAQLEVATGQRERAAARRGAVCASDRLPHAVCD